MLALLMVALDAFKPLHVDDTAYYRFARQFAADPTRPYDFFVFWYDHQEPAFGVLCPPLLPAAWSVALRFSDRPAVWKLVLVPFCLCLVFSMHALFRRFAPGREMVLTAMTALSPAVLPGMNLMLDVPALALGLGALALFIAGVDGGSPWRVAAAGLVAGLAMQTKYTALLVPAAMVLYAWTHGHRRWAIPAVLAALLVFGAWERYVAVRHGASHFVHHLLAQQDERPDPRWILVPLIASLVGSAAPYLLVLGLAALRVRAGPLLAGLAVLLGLAALALVDLRFEGRVAPAPTIFGPARGFRWPFTLADLLFGAFGLAVWVVAAAGLRRLCRHEGRQADDVFLALWLGLEVAGYFALSPFPAVRRVMGLVVVLTLILGRLAVRERAGKGALRAAAALAVVLGLGYHAVDWRCAAALREGVERARTWVDGKGGRVWFAGHWGWQFYAEQAGWQPVDPMVPLQVRPHAPPATLLRRGDWLVVPDKRVTQQKLDLTDSRLSLEHTFSVDDRLPLTTLPCYYVGHVGLEHDRGPRLCVRIYRVGEDFVPQVGPRGFEPP